MFLERPVHQHVLTAVWRKWQSTMNESPTAAKATQNNYMENFINSVVNHQQPNTGQKIYKGFGIYQQEKASKSRSQ